MKSKELAEFISESKDDRNAPDRWNNVEKQLAHHIISLHQIVDSCKEQRDQLQATVLKQREQGYDAPNFTLNVDDIPTTWSDINKSLHDGTNIVPEEVLTFLRNHEPAFDDSSERRDFRMDLITAINSAMSYLSHKARNR